MALGRYLRCFRMGWTPEYGFIPSRWDYYSELMMMYLLGMGSSSHPLQQRRLVCMEAH